MTTPLYGSPEVGAVPFGAARSFTSARPDSRWYVARTTSGATVLVPPGGRSCVLGWLDTLCITGPGEPTATRGELLGPMTAAECRVVAGERHRYEATSIAPEDVTVADQIFGIILAALVDVPEARPWTVERRRDIAHQLGAFVAENLDLLERP